MRRLVALGLLVCALALVIVPPVIAVRALLRGDVHGALQAVAPLLLIPLLFGFAGAFYSLRHDPSRHRQRCRDES